jgi:cytochrome c biogenesis protein
MSLITLCILVGAWCPQDSQVGFQKVIEQFGEPAAETLQQLGITDLFHSPFFLGLIGLLTLNTIACSVFRVFSKSRLWRQKLPFLGDEEISKLRVVEVAPLSCPGTQALAGLADALAKAGYKVEIEGSKLKGEFARSSLLAAAVTHVGLLLLLCGIIVTSWTGFNGFKMAPLGSTFNFADSEHSKLWIGKLPDWSLRVDDTRREDYATGEPKQWYSKLSVLDRGGKVIKEQEISVNHPLSFAGVDIYQSSWGLDAVVVSFDGRPERLPLQQMGETNIAFVPVDDRTMLIFSLREASSALRVFAKIPEWDDPKLLAEIARGASTKFGDLEVGYVRPVPVTGLQYKSDPGLPVTYLAFAIIMLGASLAALPHRQVWASVLDTGAGSCRLFAGGHSRRARRAFADNLGKISAQLKERFGEAQVFDSGEKADNSPDDRQMSQLQAGVN